MKSPFVLKVAACILALAASGVLQAPAAEPTAFELIKEANRFVADDVKDKVIQVRSEKSVAGLVPNIWFVVYYDKDATFKTTEVKLGSGQKLDVKRPLRQPFAYINHDRVLAKEKLKIDSDRAIKIATAEPLLEKLTIRATQLRLEPGDEGPVWRVKLWAARLRNPDRDADIGEVHLSAEDGKVVKNDLKISRVD
jgi:hypothetical protein